MATWADVQKYMPTSPPNPDMGDYTKTAVIPGLGLVSYVWQDNKWQPKTTDGGNGQETWLSPGPNGEVKQDLQASGDSSFLGAIKALLPAAAVAAPAIAGGLGLFGGAGSVGSAGVLDAADAAQGASMLSNAGLSYGDIAGSAAGGMMGVDQVGSDWATGQANMATPGGMLPVDPSTGLTLANTAAGSGVAGAVNSGLADTVGSLANNAGTVGKALSTGALASGAGGILSGLGTVAGSVAPGLAALAYANSQPGFDPSKINDVLGGFSGVNTSGSQGVLDRMQNANPAGPLSGVLTSMQGSDPTAALRQTLTDARGNAPGYVQASINPLLQSQAAGYGDMLQSQAKRGIYGSSFGSNDIANFLNTTGRGISDAGINAEQSALGLQSNIGQSIGSLTNQSLSNQANAASNIGSLTNQNLSQQGTVANQIPNTQINALNTQGNLAATLAGLNVAQQNSKNNMYGRALGLFGNSLSGNNNGSLYGGLSQIGSGLSSSLGSLLSSLGITG